MSTVHTAPNTCDASITLVLPSSWVTELNSLAHASMVSRLAYIRSRLREQMDRDLVQLGEQIEASKRFRETAAEIKEMAERQREWTRPSEWSAGSGRRWEESY